MFLALYGENVNIAEAAFISIFSMVVVFVVLLIISYMIDIVAAIISKGTEKKVEIKNTNEPMDIKVTDDTVAVIAAAIAAYMGSDVQNVNIKKIRRIDKSNTWMRRN